MPEKIERVLTGIAGLDAMLKGGLPKYSSVLMSGPTGSGKTTFGLEFIYKGAKEKNENGIFISFEETTEELMRNIPFDWDIQSLIDQKKIMLIKYDPYQYEDIIDLIRTNIKQIEAKRVVIDSITALNLYVEDLKDIRKLISDMNAQLKKLGCTSIYTGEIKSDTPEQLSSFGVEEFIADGVIVLFIDYQESAGLKNFVLIRKMRGTTHDKKMHPFTHSQEGITIQ